MTGGTVPAHLGTVAGDHGVDVVGERAVEVLGNTAASDVGNGVHRSAAAQQLQNRLDVDARGSQQASASEAPPSSSSGRLSSSALAAASGVPGLMPSTPMTLRTSE